MPTLDIGCGGNKRGEVGIDIAPWPGVDHVLKLGFDPFPYPAETFDKVWSVHSIEHVPFTVWSHDGRRTYPMKQLLSECYRVLKRGGNMEILTLCFPDPRCFQDPTHVSVWTLDTIRHFVGERDSSVGNMNDEMADLHVPFQLVVSELNSDKLLHIVVRKP